VGRIGSRLALDPLREQFEKGELAERIEIARAIAALGPEGAAVIQAMSTDASDEIRAIAFQVAEETSLNIDTKRDE
jgi:HEAT repeat protein